MIFHSKSFLTLRLIMTIIANKGCCDCFLSQFPNSNVRNRSRFLYRRWLIIRTEPRQQIQWYTQDGVNYIMGWDSTDGRCKTSNAFKVSTPACPRLAAYAHHTLMLYVYTRFVYVCPNLSYHIATCIVISCRRYRPFMCLYKSSQKDQWEK